MIRELTYRQLYVLVAVLLTFTACSNEGDALFDGERPMTFSVAAEQQTRTTRAAYTGTEFGVYATNYTGDYKTTNGILHMPNALINYAGGTCTPDKTYYWPDGNMHFAAYSPYTDPSTSSDMQITLPAKPYAGYAFQGKVDGRINWMFADEQVGSLEGKFTDGSVPINFRHALTQVKFRVRLSATTDAVSTTWALNVKSITIRNIRHTGNITFTHNNKTYSAVDSAVDANVWNTDGKVWNTETFDVGSDYNNNYLGDCPLRNTAMKLEDTEYHDVDDCLYLMPQQLYADGTSEFPQMLEVTYVMYTNGVPGSEQKVMVPIHTSAIDKWSVNKSITYSLTIEPGGTSTLTVAVQNWVLENYSNEFSDVVAIEKDEDRIHWTEGTYAKLENEKLVLLDDIQKPAELTFKIAHPLGGTWQAAFVTKNGNPNAFKIEPSEGAVGEVCTLKVSATGPNTTNLANEAELRFVVRTSSKILPVYILTNLGEGNNYTIVQSINK